jgi:hypothetical protein
VQQRVGGGDQDLSLGRVAVLQLRGVQSELVAAGVSGDMEYTVGYAAFSISLWARVQAFSSVKMGTDANYQFLLFKQNSRESQFEGYSIGLDERQHLFSGGVSSSSGLQRIVASYCRRPGAVFLPSRPNRAGEEIRDPLQRPHV